MLVLERVFAGYGHGWVLQDVALSVQEGEVVCLLGRNGAGKSTTLKSIIGLVPQVEGRILFRGQNLIGRPTHAIRRMGIGYVPEDRRIFPGLTVLENLLVGAEGRSQAQRDQGWTVERVFELFPALKPLQDRPGRSLSGGEQRMLAIARALMGDPELLLLDEPSEGLAPLVVQALWEQIRRLRETGLAILLSEQNLWFAAGLSSRIYILDKGQVQFQGTYEALLADESLKQAYLAV
ncbi:MAG: ABC transporter ATP-binding protein [Armatimonadetes bacterium]|nr:ABC transporter ATP-binding protein [Armatimonadota bacterium]MDW8154141.1 ABC transporter ATP-binding protein [Armatimonadota bacterium]